MRKLLQIVSFGLLLLLPLLGLAQQNRITGRVVDAKTKEPIPFASIGLLKAGTGVLTNEKGYFQLAGLDKSKQDSLVLMTLGYERYVVLMERNSSNNLTIELTRRYVEEVRSVCRKLTDKDIKPIDKSQQIAGTPGTQYAFYIANEKQSKLGKLRDRKSVV